MSLLGIDVDTSGCKAAAFSEEGQLLGLANQEYDYQSPHPGWAELDSFIIWKQVKNSIRKIIPIVIGSGEVTPHISIRDCNRFSNKRDCR